MTTSLDGRHIHFMGAGGIGVSAVMELARARGARVSGCDGSPGGQVPRLRALGIPVAVGHSPAHVEDCDELVYTPAVRPDHPEVVRARELGRPVSLRMQMLGRLVRGTRVIGVTGSHGKTSTTWMIAHVLLTARRDPTVLVGGVVPALDGNFRLGRGACAKGQRLSPEAHAEFVLEVDESDNRLPEILPALPVVTNIDKDHLENYGGSIEALARAMARYLASARNSGDPLAALTGCGDDRRVLKALRAAGNETGLPVYDYGFAATRAVRALRLSQSGLLARFDAVGPLGEWHGMELPMPGRHYVLNALAALTVAWRLGVCEADVRAALATCGRVDRRFQIKSTAHGVRVVDDYGHHPTEIAATIRAAHDSCPGRVAVLFQPHRYTRTAQLMDDFAACFAESPADRVLILPVYAASETPLPGADQAALVQRINERRAACVEPVAEREDAVQLLHAWARPGDTILVQGAGDVTKAADELAALLQPSSLSAG